jgi:hypothetical protein
VRRIFFAVVVAVATCAATNAYAHQGNPNFRSVFRGLKPPLAGVKVEVIGYDSLYQLRSTAQQTVTIYGYNREPYSRILPDGTVQQNLNSPAVYLNESLFATADVPAHAHAGAPAVWKTIDKTGTIQWHDHRMHYAATGTPPQVKDKHKKTKIFDYSIPVSEGSTHSAIHGTLYWVGSAGGGFPAAAGVLFALLLIGSGAAFVATRRRRRDQGTPDGDEDIAPEKEAW